MEKLWQEFLAEIEAENPDHEKLTKMLVAIRGYDDNDKFHEAINRLEKTLGNAVATEIVVAASEIF